MFGFLLVPWGNLALIRLGGGTRGHQLGYLPTFQKLIDIMTSPFLTFHINPIWPGLWKDVKARGGHYGPPCFFSFGATKSPKLNLGTFLALKTTWKAILNIFRSLSLVARGWEISIAIILEKFKIFKILSFKGVMHLRWKLRTYTIQIELEKVEFVSEKINFFEIFWFSPNAQGPPKIFDVQFFEKQTPKLAFWDLANMERNKVRKFG